MPIPSSTYRIQLHEKFTLADLGQLIGYLHQLGITTVYASPLTTAFKGSTHGYDVTNPLVLNPEIGTEQELEELAARLKSYGMTWLQDIVPNHMAYDSTNPWLYDVLERGKDSVYYGWFDINTDHPITGLGDQLMTPFLGSSARECIAKGELKLVFDKAQGFQIGYYDKTWPVPASLYKWICTTTEGYPPALLNFLHQLEAGIPLSPEKWTTAKQEWLKAIANDPALASYVADRPRFFNERPHLLETLLDSGPYLLTAASLAAGRINYRRFFTVNSLICLRMEKPEVFDAYHRQILEWFRKGWIQGLRVDHIDGLAEPKKYLRRLKEVFGTDTYIAAEKILTRDEILTEDWALEGTTGYDFLSWAGQVLTDARGSRQLLDFYTQTLGYTLPYPDIVYQRKLAYLLDQMGGELDNLTDQLSPLAGIDFDNRTSWKEALSAWMASFPVYRVYPENGLLPVEDQAFIQQANTDAKQRRPDLEAQIRFISDLFVVPHPPMEAPAANDPSSAVQSTPSRLSQPQPSEETRVAFISRLMQFTGPLAAKGIEDTTFYVYNPYIAHNEVGDSPAVAGITADEFHKKISSRQIWFPHSMNASSTHDTKRGEDSRIRLNLLSAYPQQWIDAIQRWRQMNEQHVSFQPAGQEPVDGQSAGADQSATGISQSSQRRSPSLNDEYLIYQALFASIPEDGVIDDEYRERFAGYWTKAMREAKTETHYDQPDEWYEGSAQQFITQLLQKDSPFWKDLVTTTQPWIEESFTYSLSHLLIKLTAPGVPDIYQGAELWETSLVDPDNRRPVNYTLRQQLLEEIQKGGWDAAHARRQQGAEKLFVLHHTLQYRGKQPRLFETGVYRPLNAEGPLLAFIRQDNEDWALVLVPLIDGSQPMPQSVELQLPEDAPSQWMHLFTGDPILAAPAGQTTAQSAGQSVVTTAPVTSRRLTIKLDRIPVVLLTAKTGK